MTDVQSPPQDMAFCVREIGDIQKLIRILSAQLPQFRATYEKYRGTGHKREYDALLDLQKAVTRLWDAFPAVILQLNEYGDTALAEKASKLYTVLKRYEYLKHEDYTPLCSALANFAESLPSAEKGIDVAALGHLMNRVRMGYFPTERTHVELLRKAMVFPKEPVNLLDPCCGEGLALQEFSLGANARTYGIEIDETRGEEAQKRLHRVGFGSYFHSRISLSAFQGLWLNPPYLAVPSVNGTRRLEKSFLADSIRLLQQGGILVYIIPYYRATPDVCRVLCEHFAELRIFRFVGKEFERFHQVAIIGRKIERREAEKAGKRLSEYMMTPDRIPLLTDLPPAIYPIPTAIKPVELFKGAVFNVSELADQLKRSPSIDRLFEERALDHRIRRPLLPLNLSQIGLVGASGLMNGLVECDTPHIIKGRIIKEKKTRIGTEDDDKLTLHEITSNKLIFNVLTPDGLISLG